MSRKPWYRFYPGDYAGDTRRLSMLEHGAYRLLLDALYASGEPIAEAEVNRVALAFTSTEQGAVNRVLCDHWTLTDAGWTQRRAEREMQITEARTDAGRSGGQAKPEAKPEAKRKQPSRARASQYQRPETRDPDLEQPKPKGTKIQPIDRPRVDRRPTGDR